ncbi:MAG: hypothetical protein JNL70_01025 [Saprospiraceae bacterium]|nr:hypothetical protein [Saprospiraceae bacterium]
MKKTLTFVLALGFTTAVHAQFLQRTQRVNVKNGYYDKTIIINLDTMPQVQFVSVCFNCWYKGEEAIDMVDIGDGLTWKWVDATFKPINTKGDVDGLNKFTQLNWVLQTHKHSMREESGSFHESWLFKRKE